jgi:MFS family permease
MFFFTKEREAAVHPPAGEGSPGDAARQAFPKAFWVFLTGVFLFGLGDFSRTFLIWLTAKAAGEDRGTAAGTLSIAVTLYTVHNLVSAVTAYPVGHLGDRRPKMPVLAVGFGLGVATNLLLAFFGGSLPWLVAAIILSGVSIAIVDTLQKAVAAEVLPRERRSLGFGILACGNAVGDMASSLYVGYLLQAGLAAAAFGVAAAFGAAGFLWVLRFSSKAVRSA